MLDRTESATTLFRINLKNKKNNVEKDDLKKEAYCLPTKITLAKDMKGVPTGMLSTFWDRSALSYDYIIIGAGIVGLTTAISIKQMEPHTKVLVLERGILPLGASTRNAGFASIGRLTEIADDINRLGELKAFEKVKNRWTGLQLLREFLGDEAIDFKQTGSYELITENLLTELENVEKINKLLRPIFGEDVFIVTNEKIESMGFSKKYIKALVFNKFEGELDSGKMMEKLAEKALKHNIVIRYGTLAYRPINIPNGLEIPVEQFGKKIFFQAKCVAVCVNGFSKELIPEFDISPARGQIIVTAPLKKPLRFNAPCHLANGQWYFRVLENNRILLGGGLFLNFKGESTTDLSLTADIIGPLKQILKEIINLDEDLKIDYAWAGIMGLSSDNQSKIAVVPGQPHLIMGFGCNRMGLTGAVFSARTIASLLKTHRASSPPNLEEITTANFSLKSKL